ncbi:MAG: hypothetical protein IPK11_16500 [Ignavibacteria bacterium]|nr:hypothetical protein [Ignavibacteria bacterium]
MIRSNDFANDSLTTRAERLDLIQQVFGNYAAELIGLPAAVATWANGSPYTDYTTARTQRAMEEGQSEDATALFLQKLDILRKEYQMARTIALDLFQMDERFNAFGFHLPYPERQEDQLHRVELVLSENTKRVTANETPVLPPAMITRLQNALAEATTTDDARDEEERDAINARRHFITRWNEDTKNLRTLYRWCIMTWGDDDVKLNFLGFVRSSQQGQGGGTTPPEPVSDLVLLNGILSWAAVDNATSYRVAITPDADQANWTEIYSGSDTQVPVPEPLTGGIHCRVEARNAGGYSQPTIITKVFALNTPQDFNFISGNFVCSSVNWANGYHLEESDNQTEWNLIWNQNTTSIPHTVKSGVWHYRLRAGYGSVYSAYTPTLTLDSNNFGG